MKKNLFDTRINTLKKIDLALTTLNLNDKGSRQEKLNRLNEVSYKDLLNLCNELNF